MNTRYLLILSPSEGIRCAGDRPQLDDVISVEKTYVDSPHETYVDSPHYTIEYRVTKVLHRIVVTGLPNTLDARGTQHALTEVYVERIP